MQNQIKINIQCIIKKDSLQKILMKSIDIIVFLSQLVFIFKCFIVLTVSYKINSLLKLMTNLYNIIYQIEYHY